MAEGTGLMKRILVGLSLLFMLSCGALAQQAYPDGIYRGFYYDGGIEQIAVQFELRDGVFDSVVYRGVKYKDGDYMIEDASDAQKAILRQYEQLAEYLVGKDVSAIDDLYEPYAIVEDVDAVTTATMQSSKLISALWDGLNRRPYKLVDTSKLPAAESYADGTYRGSYMEDSCEQVALEFVIKDNHFVSLTYRALTYKGVDYLSENIAPGAKSVAVQFEGLIAYLEGKPISSVSDLYRPEEIVPDVDAFSAATVRAPKVISAVWDGLGRHTYRLD